MSAALKTRLRFDVPQRPAQGTAQHFSRVRRSRKSQAAVRPRAAGRHFELGVDVQYAVRNITTPTPAALRRWAQTAWHHANTGVNAVPQVTIRIVGARESRRLNHLWRGKGKPTNVLSFPLQVLEPVKRARGSNAKMRYLLGDLVICSPVVASEAREQGKSLQAHWAHMVVHGVLHLLGYDHERAHDAVVMERREREILTEFGFPNPYLT